MRSKLAILAGAALIFAAGAYFMVDHHPPAKNLSPEMKQILRQIGAKDATGPDSFNLSSPAIDDGGMLPVELKCERDGGDGLSPLLKWTNAPEGTEGYAVVMHHYPHGTVEGVNVPSHYWLLWNIPATTQELARGNPTSIGDEGSDKDMRRTGYTPPCSPPGSLHTYIIIVYALSAPLDTLPDQDDGTVDWVQVMTAMDGKVLASSDLTFSN